MSIYCRICRKDKSWEEFLDQEGRVSTRCNTCRSGPVTGDHTPDARKASGRWRLDLVIDKGATGEK